VGGGVKNLKHLENAISRIDSEDSKKRQRGESGLGSGKMSSSSVLRTQTADGKEADRFYDLPPPRHIEVTQERTYPNNTGRVEKGEWGRDRRGERVK